MTLAPACRAVPRCCRWTRCRTRRPRPTSVRREARHRGRACSSSRTIRQAESRALSVEREATPGRPPCRALDGHALASSVRAGLWDLDRPGGAGAEPPRLDGRRANLRPIAADRRPDGTAPRRRSVGGTLTGCRRSRAHRLYPRRADSVPARPACPGDRPPFSRRRQRLRLARPSRDSCAPLRRHTFHTRSQAVWRYLSNFTAWHSYEHRVLAEIEGKLVPLPFNLNTLRGPL